MSDALAERFDALADGTDDADWLDVRRRARRGRARIVVPVAAAFAAVVTAAAFAASSGWLFTSKPDQVVAVTHVTLDGRNWRVTLTKQRLGAASALRVDANAGATTARGDLRIVRSRPAFSAVHANIPGGGQIWAGTTLGFTRRVVLIDAAGHAHPATTVTAPHSAKTPFRYFAIAVPKTIGVTLVTYEANGRSLRWSLR